MSISIADIWSARIDRAVRGEGIRAVYQPIVDLRRRTIVGYEALARFDAVDGASDPPDRWFDAAHRLSCGPALDAACLRQALAARPDLPSNCFLTVNVDPESLLVPEVRSVLDAEDGLGGLVIEITEHRRWAWDQLAGEVSRLRDRGARFAVDDAGSGYSGLQQILELRPEILKLDRSLIDGIADDEAKTSLVEMLGVFADRIDAWVLAEGIETMAEAHRLAELEVPLVQGYLFARPEAAWVGLDPGVVVGLAEFADRPNATLHRLVDPVAPIGPGDLNPADRLDGTDRHLPVVAEHGRPFGVHTLDSLLTGAPNRALVVNVGTSPVEVARRVAASDDAPGAPVLVIDNAGRYLGVVTLRRLLRALTDGQG